MDQKKFQPSRFTIRVKLMVIISSILIVSLASIILIATYFFKRDNEIRVKENNSKLTEVIALNVRSEIQTLNQSLQIMVATLTQTKDETMIKSILFGEDPNVLLVGLYDKSLSPISRLVNNKSLDDLGVNASKLDEIISKNKEKFQKNAET